MKLGLLGKESVLQSNSFVAAAEQVRLEPVVVVVVTCGFFVVVAAVVAWVVLLCIRPTHVVEGLCFWVARPCIPSLVCERGISWTAGENFSKFTLLVHSGTKMNWLGFEIKMSKVEVAKYGQKRWRYTIWQIAIDFCLSCLPFSFFASHCYTFSAFLFPFS